MRLTRASILLASTAALTVPVAAGAQLALPVSTLPDPPPIVTGTSDPVGGVVDTVTGTVGGVVDTVGATAGGATGGLTDPVTQTIDQVLGGSLPQLPTGTIDDLLGAAGLPGVNGQGGAPGAPGTKVMPDGSVVVDSRAPVTKVTVLNRNRTVGRHGKLSLRIASDEPSVVALVGTVVPGRAYKLHGRAAKRHSRKAIKIPKVVMAYRTAGALKLTIQFSHRAQQNIRGSYNSAVKLTLVAVDVARNQVTRKLTRVVKH